MAMLEFEKKRVGVDPFDRHFGLWTPTQQERLSRARLAIGGVGGVGAAQGLLLAKSGVGQIRIGDFDGYEVENIVEQAFATWDVIGQAKVDVAAREMIRHHKALQVTRIQGDLSNAAIAEGLVQDTEVVFSGVDNPVARVSLGRAALREGIPFVVGANVGWSVFCVTYLPERGGYAEAFSRMPGIKRDDLGLPRLDDVQTRKIVEREWCIWTVAFSGFLEHELLRFFREDLSHFAYCAPVAFAAASLSVVEGLKLLLDVGRVAIYPEMRVFDWRVGKEIRGPEISERYKAVSEAWCEGEEAVLRVVKR